MDSDKIYVSIFAGSKQGITPKFLVDARVLGKQLAEAGIGIICGGGSTGLMGTLIDAAVDNGGSVTGVVLNNRLHDEIPHKNLAKTVKATSLSQRKIKLMAGAKAVIALPGGPGVLDEICSTLALGRLGQLTIPLILVNTDKYFDYLIAFYKKMNEQGFRSENGFHPTICQVENVLRLIL